MGGTSFDLAERPVGKLHLLLLGGLAATGLMLATTVLIDGVEKIDFQIFIALILFYAAASVTFLVSQAKTGHFPVFDLPVFFTLICFLRFALVPAFAFINPKYLDPYLLHLDYRQLDWTLCVFVLGILAFWTGCRVWPQKTATDPRDSLETGPLTQLPLGWAVALFTVSLVARIYMTTTYGYGYALNLGVYFDNLALMQVLMFLADLGFFALTIAIIEMCYHPNSGIRRWLLATVFLNEVFWGALSGMKESLFRPFILVAAIISITKARLDKKWIAAVLAGFVVLYPIINRYRQILRSENVDVRRISALEKASRTAAEDTSREEAGWQGWVASGWSATLMRFDLLQSMATVVYLDPWQANRIRGDERWWMVPFYPFVPRFVWHNKPSLLRAMRLSILLGVGSNTSTALTYPGDLYMDYGLAGVVTGMFLLGMLAKSLTNRIVGSPAKRDLFFYSAFFLIMLNLFEADWFSAWSGIMKNALIIGFMTYFVYGPRHPRSAEDLPAARKQGEIPGVPARRASLPTSS